LARGERKKRKEVKLSPESKVHTDKSPTGHQPKTKDGQTVPCRNVKAGAGDPRNCLKKKYQNKTCRKSVLSMNVVLRQAPMGKTNNKDGRQTDTALRR
jgi:hypothetical protein